MLNETVIVNVDYHIEKKLIDGLIIGAIDGGIGYWADTNAEISADGNRYLLPIKIKDIITKKEHFLTEDNILTGLYKMAKDNPANFEQLISDNYNSDDSDIFIQCCLFNDVIYG